MRRGPSVSRDRRPRRTPHPGTSFAGSSLQRRREGGRRSSRPICGISSWWPELTRPHSQIRGVRPTQGSTVHPGGRRTPPAFVPRRPGRQRRQPVTAGPCQHAGSQNGRSRSGSELSEHPSSLVTRDSEEPQNNNCSYSCYSLTKGGRNAGLGTAAFHASAVAPVRECHFW